MTYDEMIAQASAEDREYHEVVLKAMVMAVSRGIIAAGKNDQGEYHLDRRSMYHHAYDLAHQFYFDDDQLDAVIGHVQVLAKQAVTQQG